MLRLKLNHVSKRGYRSIISIILLLFIYVLPLVRNSQTRFAFIQLHVNVLMTMVVALFGTVFGHLFPLRNERGLLRDIKSSGWDEGLK